MIANFGRAFQVSHPFGIHLPEIRIDHRASAAANTIFLEMLYFVFSHFSTGMRHIYNIFLENVILICFLLARLHWRQDGHFVSLCDSPEGASPVTPCAIMACDKPGGAPSGVVCRFGTNRRTAICGALITISSSPCPHQKPYINLLFNIHNEKGCVYVTISYSHSLISALSFLQT